MPADRGFALATSMMILALLSVLGAMAIQSTTLEVQISAHDRDGRAALYVAESALDEARYYVARGWGKIDAPAPLFGVPVSVDVELETDPPPGVPWAADQYVGFTLVDAGSQEFPVLGNSAGVPNTVTLDTQAVGLQPTPGIGRYLLLRRNILGTWDNTSKELHVADQAWSDRTVDDRWNGWTAWDLAGDAFTVVDTQVDVFTTPNEVILTLSDLDTPSGALGPFTLGINPWVATLLTGTAPPGDEDVASTDRWDRIFPDPGGVELGRAQVTVQEGGAADEFTLISRGGSGTFTQTVQLSVLRAGAPTQTTADWKVQQ